MTAERGSQVGVRLMKKDPKSPFNIMFSVIDGLHHVTAEMDIDKEKLLCTKTHQRYYMADGVKRILVKRGRLRGALFLPPGCNFQLSCVLICLCHHRYLPVYIFY